MPKYIPKNDGVDHVNVYSKSSCELGKLLTNFALTPFDHPKYGRFNSVEAAWYFAKTGFIYSHIQLTHGYEAKKIGRKLLKSSQYIDGDEEISDHFKNFITDCIRFKLWQNKWILNKLVSSDLPLAHYYYYGDVNKNPKIVELKKHDWMLNVIDDIRLKSKQYLKDKNMKEF